MGFPFKWNFVYGDNDASPNENHTKKHPTWQGEAAARDDGGQRRTGVGAEWCPGGWSASAGGAALRSAMVMFPRTTMIREGGLKRDRSAVGAALCCPTVAVRRPSPRHPTCDVAPRRVRACADDATKREKQHIEESREKKKKKQQKRRLRCFRPIEPPEQHNTTTTNLYERAPRELVRRKPSRAEPPNRQAAAPPLWVRLQSSGSLTFGFKKQEVGGRHDMACATRGWRSAPPLSASVAPALPFPAPGLQPSPRHMKHVAGLLVINARRRSRKAHGGGPTDAPSQ